MTSLETALFMLALVVSSSFFSISEIALAASRKTRLQRLGSEGNHKAEKVLLLEEHPVNFFDVVVIGVVAVANLGGIVGESFFTPFIAALLGVFISDPWLPALAYGCSVFFVTGMFILFADLIPKRLAM